MAGSLLIAMLAGVASAQHCEELPQSVGWALDQLLQVNARDARRMLGRAESALGCGERHSPPDLAKLFLVDAAIRQLEGEPPEIVDEVLAAAHRIDDGAWIDDLGPRMREQYEAAAVSQANRASARISLDVAGWDVLINGRSGELPVELPAGRHLVQVIHDGMLEHGEVVWVVEGEDRVVRTGLEARAVESEATAVVEESEAPRMSEPSLARLSVGVGFAAAFGQALAGVTDEGQQVSEPGTKLGVPLELGVVLDLDPVWVRPLVGVSPLLGGTYLFATEDGAGTSGLAVGSNVAAGVHVGTLDVGGLVGVSYPGRIGARGLVGMELGKTPLYGEARAGLNVGTGGRVEPAVALVVSFRSG